MSVDNWISPQLEDAAADKGSRRATLHDRVRVAVLNVHGFLDAPLEDFALFFGNIACDVVTLHECPDDHALPWLANKLSMHVAYAPATYAGNALLSRAPFADVRTVALTAPRAEDRSAVVARVVVDGVAVVVAGVHLEVRREVARLVQLNQLAAAIDEIAHDDDACIIAGDLNALTVRDYAPDVLAAIRAHREKNAWEPPQSLVTTRMSALGYQDAVDLAHVERPLSPELGRTCWAGTRIDYVWTRGGPWTRADVVVADVNLSDHRPLVVTLHPS